MNEVIVFDQSKLIEDLEQNQAVFRHIEQLRQVVLGDESDTSLVSVFWQVANDVFGSDMVALYFANGVEEKRSKKNGI